jgi:hypothetical protein
MSNHTDEIIILDESDLEEVHPLDEWQESHDLYDCEASHAGYAWDDDDLNLQQFGWFSSARERIREATRRVLFRLGWVSFSDSELLFD